MISVKDSTIVIVQLLFSVGILVFCSFYWYSLLKRMKVINTRMDEINSKLDPSYPEPTLPTGREPEKDDGC